MTSFQIFFIVLLVLSLIILWMILDYQVNRLIREMKIAQLDKIEGKFSVTGEVRINQKIQNIHQGVQECGYTQHLSD
ncbi:MULTISPECIES: hypothetical protein [Acinetobacter calcoaceticus/baumannii complex]|uniref:hypothetical protein n=1 Tax=Acinetobacter calcoaceticus/baumannii complex TaxID=909768 RepID=UPI0002CDAE5D|nr:MULTISPECIES: hypothetical protein [Acinetobacter calcoaceticus/baumannii complex]ENW65262.1 hypothetical protein F914_00556 [Acinetobacter baumannii NIPH 290]MCK0889741.1 hypothetical protein [Acinetobacter pittii]MCL8319594.1 hypothetical protein [Acinetobacter baumannii]